MLLNDQLRILLVAYIGVPIYLDSLGLLIFLKTFPKIVTNFLYSIP